MHQTILLMILLVVLSWLVLRRAPNLVVRRYQWPHTLQWIGLAILLAYAGFWGWWGIAEMTVEPSGFIHLLPILPIALLVYFGWRQPGIVGWGLFILSSFYTLVFTSYSVLEQPAIWSLLLRELLPGLLLVAGPLLLSALCLLIADRWARRLARRDQPPTDQHKLDRLHLSYRG